MFLVNPSKGPKKTHKAASKYMKESGALIKKGIKRYLEVGNVKNLPESGVKRAATTKEDTAIVEEWRENANYLPEILKFC